MHLIDTRPDMRRRKWKIAATALAWESPESLLSPNSENMNICSLHSRGFLLIVKKLDGGTWGKIYIRSGQNKKAVCDFNCECHNLSENKNPDLARRRRIISRNAFSGVEDVHRR